MSVKGLNKKKKKKNGKKKGYAAGGAIVTPKGVRIRGTGAATKGLYATGPMA